MINTYGDRTGFLTSFSPDKQVVFCIDEKEAIVSDSPTLTDMNTTYGKNTAVMFLIPQLFDLSEFCGAKEKFTERQIRETASLIATSYPWLKVKEVMTFFKQFKMGNYGHFYGSVDPMKVLCALKEFLSYRSEVYAEYEQQKAQEKIAEDKLLPTISYEDWVKEKKSKGEAVNFVLERSKDGQGVRYKPKPLETLVDSAKALIENRYNLPMKSLLDMRKMFREKNGMTPEEIVEKAEKNEL